MENIFENYKNINENLISLTNFILDKYRNLIEKKKPISYPIYFNIKNVLHFNCNSLNISNDYSSIQSFTDILSEKIKTGLYFLITDSIYNKSLYDYTNKNIYEFNSLKIDEFPKIKLDYKIYLLLEGGNKILGTKNNNILEIYNIKNKKIETQINLDQNVKVFDISQKGDLILVMTKKQFYLFNSKLQKVIIKNKKNYTLFYGKILSENTVGIICKEKLPLDEVANYFLIYKKNKKQKFVIKKEITLPGLDNIWYNEDEDRDYYKEYSFISCTPIFEKEFIISFGTSVYRQESDGGKEYDLPGAAIKYLKDECKEETIYYYLNIEKDENIIEISTNEEDILIQKDKTENILYFFSEDYCELNKFIIKLKNIIKNYKFIVLNENYFNHSDQFFSKDNKIIYLDDNCIYFGYISSNDHIENIKTINIFQKNKKHKNRIKSININPNLIIYE